MGCEARSSKSGRDIIVDVSSAIEDLDCSGVRIGKPWSFQVAISMEITQLVFLRRELATKCTWANIVLLTKDDGKYHKIGPMEVLWNVIFIIIDWCLADSIEFHDFLHRFR